MSANLTDTLATIRAQAERNLEMHLLRNVGCRSCDDGAEYEACTCGRVMDSVEYLEKALPASAQTVLRLTKALEVATRQRDEITEHPYDTDVEDYEILVALSETPK